MNLFTIGLAIASAFYAPQKDHGVAPTCAELQQASSGHYVVGTAQNRCGNDHPILGNKICIETPLTEKEQQQILERQKKMEILNRAAVNAELKYKEMGCGRNENLNDNLLGINAIDDIL